MSILHGLPLMAAGQVRGEMRLREVRVPGALLPIVFFFFFFNFIGYWLLGGLSLRYGVLLVCHACNFMSPNANCTPSETPNP